ncbi:MAG: 50S ribosomal protein L5 [Armatimonadetes bacterium]|nr:MAG: 50S ribosomal protein L5 [Armatimonadota bacterium]
MSRLKDKYLNEMVPKMQEEFGIKNVLAAPKLSKVVINVGIGDAKDNSAVIEEITKNLAVLSGQKPKVAKAKKSISGFKLSKGQPVGVVVTLHGERMYNFLDKLVSVVLPKVRDFRGLSTQSFDSQGNYSVGLKEQAIFPEVSFQGPTVGGRIRGMEISLVTTAKDKEQSKRLLELLGVPFKKD